MRTLALALMIVSAPLMAAGTTVGVVNFKACVEQSKLGKKEQTQFEAMKKQMETVLEQKEKELNGIATKFNDPDYMDTLSSDAEAEMKHKFRNLNQEMSALQNQYYQALNQANFKVMQKLHAEVAKVAKEVAKEKNLSTIVGDEATFYFDASMDVTKEIVSKLDTTFDKEEKS